VAVNCRLLPTGIVAFSGVIAIDTSAALLTVIVVDDEIVPDVAVIVAVPCPELVATPLLPALLLTTATIAFDELHVTMLVRFCVLPSL
jgi:hypothetical protein